MNILDDLARLVETVRSMDRAELADELARLVDRARSLDRQEVLDEVLRVTERVRELLAENHALRKRLRARLRGGDEDLSYPYEGIYWFDQPHG